MPFLSTSFVCTTLVATLLAATTVRASPLSTDAFRRPAGRSPWTLAPLVAAVEPESTIENSYIVMLKPDTPPHLIENHFNFLETAHNADPLISDLSGIQQIYDGHIKGYAGRFTEGVVQQLRAMPEVQFVEQDQIVHAYNTQKNATWGLARISHRERLRLSTFNKYVYDDEAGKGVDVYVIDTGINVQHKEFQLQRNARWGKTVVSNDVDEDGNGHGTHCAGTIASNSYGVAKAANVIAVKVLGSNGSGSMSDVVAGVTWATAEAVANQQAADAEYKATGKTSHKGSVANMSLGGGKSRALDEAVNKAVDMGLHFAVAAGNDNRDACNYSPAAAENAVTVGASTLSDERAYFSNHGECVDVFAPGLNIISTYIPAEDSVATLSGTSMASPHVAGLIAYLLSIYPSATFNPDVAASMPVLGSETLAAVQQSVFSFARSILSVFLPITPSTSAPIPPTNPTLTPRQLKAALIQLSTPDVFADLPGKTPNLLVFNNATA
ncbi:serine-type endopeptidase [Fistulina hepatica ATCC 64428]|uniref:Serine-type endopeptidase n=1 Tax=Fistulina hepatica ATCC 64428 TaxID=1128425 RepID=A0A0D7A8G7_9AGAR|nr:serine-type endopeptidase [Fistulina hepatica ATCC 64428]